MLAVDNVLLSANDVFTVKCVPVGNNMLQTDTTMLSLCTVKA